MKDIKTFIAYLLVAVFLLGSIAASAIALPENTVNQTIAPGLIHEAPGSN